jgi:hypothetical protein
MEEIMQDYQIIDVVGFDSDGEPEIRLYADGLIEVVFNFMPPSNGNLDLLADPIFDEFERVLQLYLGVTVIREDREIFTIEHPTPSTAIDLKNYLENFWRLDSSKK